MTTQKSDEDSLVRIKLEIAKLDLKLKDVEGQRSRLKQMRDLAKKLDQNLQRA